MRAKRRGESRGWSKGRTHRAHEKDALEGRNTAKQQTGEKLSEHIFKPENVKGSKREFEGSNFKISAQPPVDHVQGGDGPPRPPVPNEACDIHRLCLGIPEGGISVSLGVQALQQQRKMQGNGKRMVKGRSVLSSRSHRQEKREGNLGQKKEGLAGGSNVQSRQIGSVHQLQLVVQLDGLAWKGVRF